MNLKKQLVQIRRAMNGNSIGSANRDHYRRFKKYAFTEGECKSYEQYEASITKMYHSVEKGLSYPVYRAGFGKSNIIKLTEAMQEYAKKYDVKAFFYETAKSALEEYLRKNKECGWSDAEIENRILSLPGESNGCGGAIEVSRVEPETIRSMDYDAFIRNRHSLRLFDEARLPKEQITDALKLAQYTPSACNRQGWKSRVVSDKAVIEKILANQNGNKGFGDQIRDLIVVTGDIRYFNKTRELHQMYIDGGMYAMRVIDALHFEGAATIPMSAALTPEQEKKIRKILNADEAEVFIMFIGVGLAPEKCLTTRSERRPYVEK